VSIVCERPPQPVMTFYWSRSSPSTTPLRRLLVQAVAAGQLVSAGLLTQGLSANDGAEVEPEHRRFTSRFTVRKFFSKKGLRVWSLDGEP
jgi:hypothetical protein